MNRQALLASVPPNPDFQVLSKAEQKKIGEDFIDRILDALQADEREPDEWEGTELLAALGAILGRMYTLALVCAEKALVPVHERHEDDWGRKAHTPSVAELRSTLVQLRWIAVPSS